MPLVTRPEAIGPPARLTDGEFRNRPRGRRLSFSRQRCADERPMHRPFIVFAILAVAFLSFFTFRQAIVFRREIGLHFGIVGVFVAVARRLCKILDVLSLLNNDVGRRRCVFDLEIVGVLVVGNRCRGLRRRHALRGAPGNLRIQRSGRV
jgi:hypothetical protein